MQTTETSLKTLTLIKIIPLIGGDKEHHFRIEETGKIVREFVAAVRS